MIRLQFDKWLKFHYEFNLKTIFCLRLVSWLKIFMNVFASLLCNIGWIGGIKISVNLEKLEKTFSSAFSLLKFSSREKFACAIMKTIFCWEILIYCKRENFPSKRKLLKVASLCRAWIQKCLPLVIHSPASQKKLNRIEIKIKFTHGFIRFTKKLMWKFCSLALVDVAL